MVAGQPLNSADSTGWAASVVQEVPFSVLKHPQYAALPWIWGFLMVMRFPYRIGTCCRHPKRFTRCWARIWRKAMAIDGNDNLASHTDRRGKVTAYQYDALNRRTFAGFRQSGGTYESTINYTWDGDNRLTFVTESTEDGVGGAVSDQGAAGQKMAVLSLA
jgi:YD repeat-containing protein